MVRDVSEVDTVGNIRTKLVKRIAKQIVLNFQDQVNTDFENNKHVVANVTNVESKKMRNEIAGYVTKIMKKIKEQKIQTLESLEV